MGGDQEVTMVFRIDDHEKLIREKTRKAINFAMEGHWREAAAVNGDLLELCPDDVEASNRQGRAHFELGERNEARSAFERSLRLAPGNTIARKNIERLDQLAANSNAANSSGGRLAPAMFISDSGLSATVILGGTAESSDCTHLSAGAVVELHPSGNNLSVHDTTGLCLGAIPPNLASRLRRLMEAGNRYDGAVVNASPEAVTVLLRETYRHPSQSNVISFPTRASTAPEAPEIPEAPATVEDEEGEALLDAVGTTAESDRTFPAFDAESGAPESLESVAEAELDCDDEEMEEA